MRIDVNKTKDYESDDYASELMLSSAEKYHEALTAKMDKESKGRKYDNGKARYDLIPDLVEEEIAKVFTYGAAKYNEGYSEENWRKLDHQQRRLYSATRRHIQAVIRGEKYDKESGFHHYAHACSNLMMLMQLDLESDNQYVPE